VNNPQHAIDEQLSPELVLVFPPELRARVLAGMRPPPWPAPRRQARQLAPPAPAAPPEPWPRALGALVVARVAQLGLIFLIGTVLTLAMSVVAHAFP
jgi:hypothetical protein